MSAPGRMTPDAFLAHFAVRADRDAMLHWLLDVVSDKELAELAGADAGFNEADNMRALQRIASERVVPQLIDVGDSWLQECCSLTQWSVSETGRQEGVAYRCVALATTILIHAAAPGCGLEDYVNSIGDTVAALLVAVDKLGAEAQHYARWMLADGSVRYHDNQYDEPDGLFCALGLLVLTEKPPAAAIEYVLSLEQELFERDMGSDSKLWLYRLTFFDQRRSLWRVLLLDMLSRASGEAAVQMRDHVEAWP
ncbi:MAG: hypothetical protein AB8H80_06255 [Planctomycetota bacterium]